MCVELCGWTLIGSYDTISLMGKKYPITTGLYHARTMFVSFDISIWVYHDRQESLVAWLNGSLVDNLPFRGACLWFLSSRKTTIARSVAVSGSHLHPCLTTDKGEIHSGCAQLTATPDPQPFTPINYYHLRLHVTISGHAVTDEGFVSIRVQLFGRAALLMRGTLAMGETVKYVH